MCLLCFVYLLSTPPHLPNLHDLLNGLRKSGWCFWLWNIKQDTSALWFLFCQEGQKSSFYLHPFRVLPMRHNMWSTQHFWKEGWGSLEKLGNCIFLWISLFLACVPERMNKMFFWPQAQEGTSGKFNFLLSLRKSEGRTSINLHENLVLQIACMQHLSHLLGLAIQNHPNWPLTFGSDPSWHTWWRLTPFTKAPLTPLSALSLK